MRKPKVLLSHTNTLSNAEEVSRQMDKDAKEEGALSEIKIIKA